MILAPWNICAKKLCPISAGALAAICGRAISHGAEVSFRVSCTSSGDTFWGTFRFTSICYCNPVYSIVEASHAPNHMRLSS